MGGTALRGGGKDRTYYARSEAYRQRRQEDIRRDLDAARQARDEGEWASAAEKAGDVLAMDPMSEEAQEILRQAWRRQRLPHLLAALGALALLGWLFGRPLPADVFECNQAGGRATSPADGGAVASCG